MIILAKLNLLSSNDFNLVQVKMLFGKELILDSRIIKIHAKYFNGLLNEKIVDWSKIKGFA